jgi:NADH pyrophosphatase NudC (nudix superfamily)
MNTFLINKRKSISRAMKNSIFERDGYTCRYCGWNVNNWSVNRGLTIDHILPVSYNEDNKEKNLVTACNVCNGLVNNKVFKNFTEKRRFIRERCKDKGFPIFTIKTFKNSVMTPQKRLCEMCGESYIIKNMRNKNQRFCSASCRKKFWLEKQIVKVCPNCGYKIK